MQRRSQPSIQDVAKLAGVSLGTVSNVLNYPDRVREATAMKVQRAIEQLGFVRNGAARQLKAGKSRALGLVVLDAANPFFGELAKGAEDAAVEDNYQILLGNSASDPERESSYLKMFQEQRLSGVLLSPAGEIRETVAQLRAQGTQVVLVDCVEHESLGCSVSVDDVAGGRLAAQHLIDIGRKRIAFVGGSLEIHQVADRFNGANQAVSEAGGAVTLKKYTARAQDVLSGREIGLAILQENKDSRPDAIFAANDLLAVGLLQAFALQNSIAVPDEIAIIGYDDIDFAKAAVVPLSSIKQPAHLIGSTALEMLIEEIESSDSHKHRQITFQPELVIRESSAR